MTFPWNNKMAAQQNVNVKVTFTGLEWLEPLVVKLMWKLDQIMATQDEIIAKQQEQLAQINKINAETRSLIDKVKELLEQIASGAVKEELANSTQAVSDQLQIVDDLVPDAP